MADEVIGRLGRGYEQMLGRRFEGGVDLSGGEWQKVALARAYLRDAQVLILDEPTAALDARSEFEVFQRFAELTTGKMALFISHRFSTVRMADRIVVLEDGRIAEEGKHEASDSDRRTLRRDVRNASSKLSIRDPAHAAGQYRSCRSCRNHAEPRLGRRPNRIRTPSRQRGTTLLPSWRGCPVFLRPAFLPSIPGKSGARSFRSWLRVDASVARGPLTDDIRWLRDNSSLVYSELATIQGDNKLLRNLPHVRTSTAEVLPRVLAFAQGYLRETAYHYQDQTFITFCRGFQSKTPLELREFNVMGAALKLVLLEEISVRGRKAVDNPEGRVQPELAICVQSLREVSQTSWFEFLEPLILFGHILRQDPVGAYAAMDPDSRHLYRKKVAAMASRSDFTEIQIAKEALLLAQAGACAELFRSADRSTRIPHRLLPGRGRARASRAKNRFAPDLAESSAFVDVAASR